MNCYDDTIKDGETGGDMYAIERYKVALGKYNMRGPFA
jgi:hypothetical protein